MAEAAGLKSVTSSLLSTGRYSDLQIVCKEKTFNVHRAICCLASKVLAAAVDREWKESTTGIFVMEDDDPDTVERLISYMYTMDYTDGQQVKHAKHHHESTANLAHSQPIDTTGRNPLLNNALAFVLGDKYDVSGFKNLAKAKYEAALPDYWNSASFVDSLKLLYEASPDSERDLRDIAVKAAGNHARELMDHGEFCALCKANAEIAFDVLAASLVSGKTRGIPAAPAVSQQYEKCPVCDSEDIELLKAGTMNATIVENAFVDGLRYVIH
ncbi:POZ [Glarea lozoyensis ATCC 20868]|uniref:POZ n=1 Tax=Glarea lozoyensis (strain ATCC 20868 / MF5171) TaxID=1116229 RepID=S3E609_GLAL2|nr:POZ [Glarea lozoyensis ATCC 20868]EPE33778.1 POZ [Glarea lozoyensis ATCC 20868]